MRVKAAVIILCLTMTGPFRAASYGAEKNSTELYKEGLALAEQGKLDLAELSFKKTVEANPWYCLGHYGLGRVYMYKPETLDRSILHLKRCVNLDPEYAPGYFYLGMAQMHAEKYTDAIHSFSSAFEKDNSFVEALYNIGVIYDLLGDEYKSFYYYRRYFTEQERLKKRPF